MTDDRDVLMNAVMDLLDDAIRKGATPYDIVSTLAAVLTNVLGAMKPDAREDATAFITSRLPLGIDYEAVAMAKARKN